MVGGYISDSGLAKRTEIVTIDPPTLREGPLLPNYFVECCSVLVDDKVFLMGGSLTGNNDLLMIDVRTSEMVYKSELNQGHFAPACAQLTGSNGKKHIVVSGGYPSNVAQSTEIYDVDLDIWQKGKKSFQ